ncbi:uncharacterized protein SCHCODRAFT_01102715 [Schizophyllum commune H4-8]|nr:uncharacterized protein SCHCODRAFT_01102715 [Schizophyllum commune H4-8]KAI5888414.1 hypothetical protein SCHCODRAFT_01102715 [Schizophyllum commune H4-8]
MQATSATGPAASSDTRASLSRASTASKCVEIRAVNDPNVDWRSLFVEGPELRDALEDDSSHSASDPDEGLPSRAQSNLEPSGDIAGNQAVNDGAQLLESILATLQFMKSRGLRLSDFLDAILWGNKACIHNNVVRGSRTQLTRSPLLPRILCHLYHPPRISHGTRPYGTTSMMREVTCKIMEEEMECEMRSLSLVLYSKANLDLTDAELDLISLSLIISQIRTKAPLSCWDCLLYTSETVSLLA